MAKREAWKYEGQKWAKFFLSHTDGYYDRRAKLREELSQFDDLRAFPQFIIDNQSHFLFIDRFGKRFKYDYQHSLEHDVVLWNKRNGISRIEFVEAHTYLLNDGVPYEIAADVKVRFNYPISTSDTTFLMLKDTLTDIGFEFARTPRPWMSGDNEVFMCISLKAELVPNMRANIILHGTQSMQSAPYLFE